MKYWKLKFYLHILCRFISITEFLGEGVEDDWKRKAELAFDIIDKYDGHLLEAETNHILRDKDGFITKQEFSQLSDKITKKQVIVALNNIHSNHSFIDYKNY